LNNKRGTAPYGKYGKSTDFLTVLDPEYLIKLILFKDTKFCTEAVISEDSYKVNCKNIDNNGTETKFTIEFL